MSEFLCTRILATSFFECDVVFSAFSVNRVKMQVLMPAIFSLEGNE